MLSPGSKLWSGVLKRITKHRVLEELSAGSAMLFAPSQYGSGAYVPQSASIVCSTLFLYESFSRVFAAAVLKGKFWYFK